MNDLLRLSCPFILASESPRRRALLERIDIPFRIQPSPVDEELRGSPPPPVAVKRLARRKVKPVATQNPRALVLAADTVVAHEDEILTKPLTPDHASEMLHRLSDTSHTVYTGIALAHAQTNREADLAEKTTVVFGSVSEEEIQIYVRSGAPMDKAGGYGIQDHTGALLIDQIKGDYYNVVGLPLRRFYLALREKFSDLLRAAEQ